MSSNTQSEAQDYGFPEDAQVAFHPFLSQPSTASQGLLAHLQVGLPNPLDLLLNADTSAAQSLLEERSSISPLKPAAVGLSAGQAVATVSPLNPTHMLLDQGVRLSWSKIWDIQAHYYANQGVNAWENAVPNFVTSSVYMAESYAESILAFLTDYYDQLDLNEPLYVVEMATGAGRFSFHLLRELTRKMAAFSRFRAVKLRYVMTDFTVNNVEFWQSHERFAPFVAQGVLDFAVFNPLEDDSFTLTLSGQRLAAGQVVNPMIAIANYFFDSIPMDVFRVENKTLKEGLVYLERSLEGIDPDSFPHIGQVTPHFQYRELLNRHYYPDAGMNAVLNTYRHQIKAGTVLFPVGAFDVVRRLQAISSQRLVLLSSDKAYTCAEDMIQFETHEYAIHDGAFSYMVNYHALAEYFQQQGGQFFCTTAKNLSVQTVCLISMPAQEQPLEHLRYVFEEKIDRANPAAALCATMPGKESKSTPVERLNYLLAQLRMQLADPFVFPMVTAELVDLIGHGWRNHHLDLLNLMDAALDNYYWCPGESKLPFWLSEIYYAMGHHEQSLNCLQMTSRLFGDDEVLLFLMGQNYEQMQQLAQARACYESALAINPEYSHAIEALNAL